MMKIERENMYNENLNTPITPDTKVGELLETYPGLENVLIDIAPVFSKLKNPVLRKTIAKVTSLKQAAVVGNVSLGEMVNRLRSAAGQDSLVTEPGSEWQNEEKTEISATVKVYDARYDLEYGEHPAGKVFSEVSKLTEGETYLLITPFVPAPLIDKLKDKGYKAVSRKVSNNKFETYFSK